MKNWIKKCFMIILLIMFIILFYQFIFLQFWNKYQFEKDSIRFSKTIQNSPFSLSKMILYSSAHGENQNTTFQKSSWVLNLLQYSDIAIYLEHSGEELTSYNTIKKLSLENIQISTPNLGKPCLYYLDSINFGTANFNRNYKLDSSIEFTVLNDENKNNTILTNTPVFFTDCSNPITLKYVNHSIKDNYSITSQEPIFFDGRLLHLANISLNDLKAHFSLTIHLVSNDEQHYFYPLSVFIPLENNSSSIFEGSILIEKNFENQKFIQK